MKSTSHRCDESLSLSNCAVLLRKTKSVSDGKVLHNHLLQHGHCHATFLKNCLMEMYGNCNSVDDARSVFDDIKYPNIYSWNLIIRAYAQNGDVGEAQNLFDRTPNPDSYTWNILMTAYIKHGSLQDAQNVFQLMPHHSIVSWTTIVAALARHGQCQEALDLFYRMHSEGFSADMLTFLRALDACSITLALVQGQEIHAALVESGFDEHFVVKTSLISMYGKCESLVDARSVFAKVKNRDIVCWTAIITACAQNDEHKEAIRLFLKMQNEGLRPDSFTYVCLLDACTGLTLLQEGKWVHAAVAEGGHEHNFMMGTALINLYGKCRSLEDARSVFSCLSSRDAISWNAMISALVDTDHSKDALELFWQMHLQNVKPDNVTILCSLQACNNLVAYKESQEIHMAILEYGHDRDVMLMNSLINVYGKSGSLHDAKHIFNGMVCQDAITWNVLISVHVVNHLVKESLNIFRDMQRACVKANDITFAYALDACGLVSDLQKGQEVHALLCECGYHEDSMLRSSLLKMYGKCKSIDDAVHVFESMQDIDIVSWTAMIGAFVENGSSEAALDLYQRMQLKGVKPDTTSYVCALDACASLAALDRGEEIHGAVLDSRCGENGMVGNALINMYGKCGIVEKARAVFESLPEPNLATWNALIAAFASSGHGDEALDHIFKMQGNNVKPDDITFVSILTACSHAGWIYDGGWFFESMKENHRILPLDDHFVCMIDLFGRAGHLEVAVHLLEYLSVKALDVALQCLLGSCRIHNDYERALHVAETLSGLDSKSVAPFVMLANMSAAAGEWASVAHYRQCLVQQVYRSVEKQVDQVSACKQGQEV